MRTRILKDKLGWYKVQFWWEEEIIIGRWLWKKNKLVGEWRTVYLPIYHPASPEGLPHMVPTLQLAKKLEKFFINNPKSLKEEPEDWWEVIEEKKYEN